MGSDPIVTYKRKRTLLKSHFPSEGSVSGNSNNLHKQEELKSATTIEGPLKEGHSDKTLMSAEAVKQDEPGSSSTGLSKKHEAGPALITYCRRSKQKRSAAVENIKSLADTEPAERPAGSCSVDFKNEISNEGKKPRKDVDNASSLSAQVPASAEAMLVDNRSLFPITRATEAPSTALPSQAARNFDCNLLPQYDSDENLVPGPSDSHHARDSTDTKKNEQSLALQIIQNDSEVRPVADKGKGLLDSEPVHDKGKGLLDSLRGGSGTSSGNNYPQLFLENRSSETLRLSSDSHKTVISDMVAEERTNQLKLSGSGQASRFLGSSSLQPEPMGNGPTYYAPVYGWPNLHIPVQLGEAVQDLEQCNNNPDRALSLPRQRTMLDNILNKARSARGERSTDSPNTWLDEELDSLWIGVRRHGMGNWETILKDRKLNFLPWKTPKDLAAKWEEEQSRLFFSSFMPRYQVQPDASPREVPLQSTSHALGNQNPSYDYSVQKKLFGNPMSVQTTMQVQTPGANFSPYMYWGPFNPPHEPNLVPRPKPSQIASSAKGNLPHWLKEAVGTPPGPSESQPQTVILHHVASRNNRSRGLLKKTELQNRGKAPCANPQLVIGWGTAENQQKDWIVIPSDGSSEETVSDDRGART